MIVSAAVYFKPEQYNPRLRATVPQSWLVEFDAPIPGDNIAPVFVGETRAAAVRNAIAGLKSRGLTGRLRLHA